MNVKPTIRFLTHASDARLISRTETILNGMTDNPNYPTPTPPLDAITSAKDQFVTAVANAANGGKQLTATKNARRASLVELLRQLAVYLHVACKGDLAVLISSGFPIQKPHREPIGVLPAPGNVTVTFGPRSGELTASASPIAGAAIYNWRVTTAAEPTVVVQTSQTTAASHTLSGLTPGVVYNIQANVVGSAGPSDWSDPVPHMAA